MRTNTLCPISRCIFLGRLLNLLEPHSSHGESGNEVPICKSKGLNIWKVTPPHRGAWHTIMPVNAKSMVIPFLFPSFHGVRQLQNIPAGLGPRRTCNEAQSCRLRSWFCHQLADWLWVSPCESLSVRSLVKNKRKLGYMVSSWIFMVLMAQNDKTLFYTQTPLSLDTSCSHSPFWDKTPF